MFHVASGVRNPLRYGQLVDLVQSWFTEHPLYDTDGQPIVVPDWSFPGRGRVQRQLDAPPSAHDWPSAYWARCRCAASGRLGRPRRGAPRSQAERALGYVELYGAYTETEALFRVDRLLELCGTG